MLLFPSASVAVGEGSTPVRKFWLEDEYGAPVDITGYAFQYRVYRRLTNADGDIVDVELADVTGAIVDATEGEFSFTYTTDHTTLVPGSYTAEIVAWSSGTVTDEPTERYRGLYTVEGRLESP